MALLAFAVLLAAASEAVHPGAASAKRGNPHAIPVAQLKPMSEKDIRLKLPGCLDEGPIPADGGPLCFGPDGHAVRYSGWGNREGHYIIVGNKIVITNHDYVHGKDFPNYALSFYRDRRGNPYYRYDSSDLPDDAYPLRVASLPQPEPPLFRTGARKVAPLGNTASWISEDDYPFDGRAERHRGTVIYSLKVSPDGRVTNCSVSRSSGYPSLDQATCRLVVRRGRFAPARDAAGTPIASVFTSRVVW